MTTAAQLPATESPATQAPRQSNMELLRIIAMLMVLGVHANYLSLGEPTAGDLLQHPLTSCTRILLEVICIVCVNVFVLISGWFGIRPTVKGFCNFIFQCLFFSCAIYLTMILAGKATLSVRGIADCLYLTSEFWFVKAYMLLYILAPALNLFIRHAGRALLGRTLIFFYLIQSIFGWISGAAFMMAGYSTLSFIGLYLLAAYLRAYKSVAQSIGGGKLFVFCALANTILGIAASFTDVDIKTYAYCNPIVVLQAAGLLLWFARLNIGTRKWINAIAKSSFAAYLLHINVNIQGHYLSLMRQIYDSFSGITCLCIMFAAVCAVFLAAVLFDRVRIIVWKHISLPVCSLITGAWLKLTPAHLHPQD